jgi:hypothetical protein
VKQITNEQLRDFFAAKAPNACPWCGHDEWAVFAAEPPNEHATSAVVLYDLLGYHRKPPLAGAHIPTLTMVCTNCGDVREVSRQVVEKWLEEKENG